jgi:hypothetical protein
MLIKCDKFGCYVDKREESHQAEQVELDQAIGNIQGQTPTQNTTRRFKIGRGGARFAPKAPQPEPYKGYKTAGNEAGLKAPEARNEALVYDDKTHDQPSETPEENQAKVQKGKNPRNVEAGYRVHTDTGESAGSCDAKCQREHGIRCTINGCEKILPERMGEVREHWAEHDHENKFLRDDQDKLRERMGKEDKLKGQKEEGIGTRQHVEETEAVYRHATGGKKGVRDSSVAGEEDMPKKGQIRHEIADEKGYKGKAEDVNKITPISEAGHTAMANERGAAYGEKPRKAEQKPFCPSCGRDHVKEDKKVIQDYKDTHGGSQPTTFPIRRGDKYGCPSGNYRTGESKKGEDWSNADGDLHSGMYNQNTDEGGMGYTCQNVSLRLRLTNLLLS